MKFKQIYKITYPNGKIYIGKDLTGTLTYFGSVDADYVEKYITIEERKDFTIRKEIVWETSIEEDSVVNKKEVEFILYFESNNPKVGYNKWPKFHEEK